ncbi:hypothetical protein BHM03_00059816 [Ensete ventricosum]|nr:hypothetical protein BHM03_00059816 [Ensete ventricosum]
MHPLRFLNSGFRAKVFVRIIGFKLRVMRLNRVELFYALVAAIGNESRRSLWGRGDHMHAVCIQSLQGVATRGHGRQRPACKGLPPAASPATNKGDDVGRRGGHPLQAGCRSQGLRAASSSTQGGGGGAVRVREEG